MAFSRAQKKYLKKNLRRLSLAKIAAELGVSEEEILKFLKSHWRAEKYQKFLKTVSFDPGSKKSTIPDRSLESGWFKQNWKILLFLSFLVLAVYFNSLGNDFVSDDISAFLENKNLGNIHYVFQQPYTFIRRLPYFIAYKIAGLNPLFFRIINVIFHLGTVWLIYALISLMAKPPLAFLTAGIFAVHPILTESVTWISGGGYSQYSFFFLSSFLAYLLSQKKRKFYPLAVLAFALSLSSSEKAIVLPFIFLLYELSFGELGKNWGKLIPFFALSGVWTLYLIGPLSERLTALETTYYQEPGISNPFIQIPIAVTNYLELIFWPKNLTLYHSEMIFSQLEYFLRLGGFILFLATTAYFFKKDRRIFFWLSFFLISLLPTLTPFRISWVVAERYVYLGALGIFVVAAMAIQKLGEVTSVKDTSEMSRRMSWTPARWREKVSLLLLGIILITLSARTILRNADWKNEDTLWLAAAKTSPSSPQNHNNLGDLYARRGELEKAVEEFKRAIALKPNYGDAYHNLANTYHELGKDEEAIENYQKALSFNPNLWQSHQNLAGIYFEQEKFDLARQELEKAININPQSSNLHTNLGIIYLKLDDKDKAKEAFQQALHFDPQNQRAKQFLTP